MFVSLKANRKRIIAFIVLAAAVAAACLLLRWNQESPSSPEPIQVYGETNEERLTYLQSFGWQLDSEPVETREVMIPAQFNDVYTNYNAMQQAQGFDLRPYAGEVCTQYKYHITNYSGETEVYATLLVYGRLVIGGDIACAKANGFMHGFAKDSARYGEATPVPDTSSIAEPETSPNSASSTVNSQMTASSTAGDSVSSQTETETDTAQDTGAMESMVSSQPTENAESAAGEILDDFPID